MNTDQAYQNLRLLLVGPFPPPFGGVASHLITLIQGMHARGVSEIAIISFTDKSEVEQVEGATLYRFNLRQQIYKLFSIRGIRTLIITMLKMRPAKFSMRQIMTESLKALIIHQIAEKHRSNVVSFYQSNLSCALVSCYHLWKNRRGIVLTVFGEVYDSQAFFAGRETFIDYFFSLPSAVVSSSKHCACSFKKIFGILRDVEPVYYGIDLNRFAASELRASYRSELKLHQDDILLLFMGRFSKEMGIGRVLEIAPILIEQFPQIQFLLAGSKGPLASAALSLAEKYPHRVRVLLNVPFDLQASLYAASDIVLAPSHDQHACMGMSIKEAMAASRPVIGSDAGGIPEAIVHGETGFLVPLDETRHIDAKQLCHFVELLAADAHLRSVMGLAARQRAESQFTMDQTVNRMGQLFMAALPT